MKRSIEIIENCWSTLRISALVLFVTGLTACSDMPTETELNDEEQILSRLEELGFRMDMVEDRGHFFIIEGDIAIHKSTLKPRPSDPSGIPGPLFQYHTSNLVDKYSKIHNVKVDISHLASHSGWYNAAVEALTHWNSIPNSYVKLVAGTPADIVIRLVSEDSRIAGWAMFPRNGGPGDTIYLNRNFYVSGSSAHAVYVRNVVHEIGHALGLRHTNWNQNDCLNIWGQPVSCNWNAGPDGAIHIPGTPTSGGDAASVMNGLTADYPWIGFSAHDKTAVAYMYPLPAPTSLTVTGSGGKVALSWSAVPGALYYRYRKTETYYLEDYERGRHSEYRPGPWSSPIYATSVVTGSTWTGHSSCYIWFDMYTSEYLDYTWEVEAVFANGSSKYNAYKGSQDVKVNGIYCS